MSYELYTLPNCEKCAEVKDYLKGKEIGYEEINLGITAGKKTFREIYKDLRKDIKRDSEGMTLLPILIKKENSKIELLAQADNIKSLFG